jgi:arylsulfatase A-like enzyme
MSPKLQCLTVTLVIGFCFAACGAVKPSNPAVAATRIPRVQISPAVVTPKPPSPTPTVTDSAHPTQETPIFPPNVIVIIADALRADHVSAYGYQRQTTPNLDALIADQGVHFQDATTTSPWTCPANASMATGRSPSSLGATWETIRDTLPSEASTLAEYLHTAGYYTAGFANTYCVKAKLGFDQGFDHYDDSLSDRPTSDKARAEEVNHLVIDWLQNTWTRELSGTQPLFLFLYYFDPHGWYDPLPPYDTLYDATYTGTLTPEVYRDGEVVVSGDIVPMARDVEHLLALYDGEITYWDVHLGQLLAYLQDIHISDNALIVVTADHGELFGEHGVWVHGNALYEEVIRVPLLMRYTGIISPGQVIDVSVQNMDLMPTILDWVGLPVPEDVQAVSLRPIVEGRAGTADITRPIFSEVDAVTDPQNSFYWIASRVDLRAIQRGEWKLVHHVEHWNDDELFLLQPFSPYEVDNLLSTNPEQAQELRRELFNWFGFSFHSLHVPCIKG